MVRSERGGTRDEKLRMWNECKGVRVEGGGAGLWSGVPCMVGWVGSLGWKENERCRKGK